MVTVEFDPLFILRGLQMQFLVRPLGYQRQIAGRPAVAVSMRFNERTLAAIRRAYGSGESILSYRAGPERADTGARSARRR